MWVLLSHTLSVKTPCYDEGHRLEIIPVKQISKGDYSNTFLLKTLNHLGTHVDAPNHFDPSGRKIASYKADELIFHKPLMIELPKGAGELITANELRAYHDSIASSDIVLIRTGFQVFRDKDPVLFMKNGPSLSAEAAAYLRSVHGLRALGVDMISISSPSMREEGREAHKQLLKDRSFLIIEDMDLLGKPSRFKKVIVAPLMIEDVDSAPCTVFAEV